MDVSTKAAGLFHHRIRSAALIIIFAVASLLLILSGQYTAVVLLPIVVLLLHAIERRDRHAQALAERIADARQIEKVEVPHGPWGELARAVNGLLQDRRVEQRLRAALPAPLPIAAVQSLLGGDLAAGGQSRPVAVLLVSAPVRAPAWEHGVRRSGLVAWQALAQITQDAARRYGALLQPCGDAVMLVFGAFEDRPAGESLHDALAAAALLQHDWQSGPESSGALALALASGHALAAALPGLGFCVVGAPVEQAVGLQQLASRARRSGLLCSEESYHALRRDSGTAWQPTDLRVSIANRPPQVVYRWSDSF
jgi:class 3 adenylate cyclase